MDFVFSSDFVLLAILSCDIFIVVAHFSGPSYNNYILPAFLLVFVIGIVVYVMTSDSIPISHALTAVLSYSALAYTVICDWLREHGAAILTSRRGEKWVKEIDYLYLLLGSLGVVATISKMPNVTKSSSLVEYIGPLFIATAVVLRLIKTRAEIGSWNKASGPIGHPKS
ncbi:hypothetical protein ONR75_27330 [Rhodopseudomonas sp. P2A-2r]|uniref:hypothetical protein n=1 Tax=Rhodopseudomonas sp. P2A-2r TaxID=2991972 RepID=UPI0022348FB6|nr:hypothetical protein [Rhodopseudomonas sp. P2A-2r]UZE48469.1 hypothetical protein ONR75_27330 [Rhodopseudomonas sp. P2A-2r]